MRDDIRYIQDIFEAIERIEKYAVRGRDSFEQDELIQTWCVHYLQLIGEAARSLSDAFRQLYSQTPWRQIIAMRHILVHEYFHIDIDQVWSTIAKDLPALKKQIGQMLQDAKDGGDIDGIVAP